MVPRIPRLVMAAPMAAALAVTLAASGGAPMAGSDTPALRSISSRLDGAISTVMIEASEPVAYLTSQPDPLTVLVDLRNVTAGGFEARPPMSPLAPVTGVDVETANAPDGSPVTRIRVNLDRAAKHRVRSARNVILVEVERPGSPTRPEAASAESRRGSHDDSRAKADSTGAAASVAAPQLRDLVSAPRAPAAAAGAAARANATELRSVTTGEMPDGYAITLAGNGPLVASSVEEAKDLPHRVLLDFRNVGAGRVAAVTHVNSGDIHRVRVGVNSRDPLITRVVIDLARKLPYTVQTVGEELRVLFQRAVSASAAVVAAADPVPAEVPRVADDSARTEPAPPVADETTRPEQVATIVQPPPVQLASVPAVAAAAAAPVAAAPLAPAAAPMAPAAAPQPPAPPQPPTPVLLGTGQTTQRVFTGDPVTLDFQGADLRAVLRTFAEISQGLNIVIDPSIQGTVDVSLRDVPWDQALDIILRANKLGYIVEGNIVRIVPLTVLAQEREEQRKLADATALAGDLRVLTRPLSYAKAADLVPIITRSALSSRGDVQVDVRTNTLIIRDLADRLTNAAELLTALDRPQPQVEIEARIVQVNREFAKDLGILWGFNGRVDPTVGTTTGLTFPNSAAITAGTGGVSGTSPSAISLALGSVTGALDLNVQLRALESQRKLRVLSTPRVTTQNNVDAEIAQGDKIPVQTVSNNTVTTTYIDAALTLRVRPQITAAGTVIMTIAVDNGSAEPPAADGTRVINTQRAVTTVMVADGDTTVIGGIFTASESSTTQRTPLLHRIPLLGWLFRNQGDLSDSGELLIFITPRIAK